MYYISQPHPGPVAQGHENAGVLSQRNIVLCPWPDTFAFKTGIYCPREESLMIAAIASSGV